MLACTHRSEISENCSITYNLTLIREREREEQKAIQRCEI